MKIVTVEYRELRTGSGYNNTTVGAVAEVLPGQSPEITLAELQTWVGAQFQDEGERAGLQQAIRELQWKKENLERQFNTAGERWQAMMASLDKLGIQRPEGIPDTLESLPF